MKLLLICARSCAWLLILVMIFAYSLVIFGNSGWELRITVRGLGGEPLREYSTQGVDGWHWVRDYVYRVGGLLVAVEPNEQGSEDVLLVHFVIPNGPIPTGAAIRVVR